MAETGNEASQPSIREKREMRLMTDKRARAMTVARIVYFTHTISKLVSRISTHNESI
jgi:hypothetical protein